MSTTPPNPRQPYPSTYFVQDRSSQDEITRLAIQDQLITAGMGGVLPEQPDPTIFQHVLDVGCGTGGWLIEAAKIYPTMTKLIGIDANNYMIEYAQAQARAEQVDARVKFHAMDALMTLDFPQDYFDLVNVRFATAFVRTWEWPRLLTAIQYIIRPGGVIRLTEYERVTSSSPATIRMLKMAGDAFYRAGYLFVEGKTGDTFSEGTVGVTGDLERLLQERRVQNIQTHCSTKKLLAGTPESESFAEETRLAARTVVPFVRKWGCLPDNYETLYQEMLDAMQQPDYETSWSLLTAWGTKEVL